MIFNNQDCLLILFLLGNIDTAGFLTLCEGTAAD